MDYKDIIKSFRQGGTGNCVTIAIIKAGIEVFGVNNIFTIHQNTDDEGFAFMMRDGFEAKVSAIEVQKAKTGSRFIMLGNQEVFNYANICFAAMAKRAMIEGNDDTVDPTYEQAIDTLNDGEYYLHGPNWIGLRHHFKYIGRKYSMMNPGCVGASRAHCFYVSNGWEDSYGTPNHLNLLERRFAHWFRITAETVL
jgi:hypothetical protein